MRVCIEQGQIGLCTATALEWSRSAARYAHPGGFS